MVNLTQLSKNEKAKSFFHTLGSLSLSPRVQHTVVATALSAMAVLGVNKPTQAHDGYNTTQVSYTTQQINGDEDAIFADSFETIEVIPHPTILGINFECSGLQGDTVCFHNQQNITGTLEVSEFTPGIKFFVQAVPFGKDGSYPEFPSDPSPSDPNWSNSPTITLQLQGDQGADNDQGYYEMYAWSMSNDGSISEPKLLQNTFKDSIPPRLHDMDIYKIGGIDSDQIGIRVYFDSAGDPTQNGGLPNYGNPDIDYRDATDTSVYYIKLSDGTLARPMDHGWTNPNNGLGPLGGGVSQTQITLVNNEYHGNVTFTDKAGNELFIPLDIVSSPSLPTILGFNLETNPYFLPSQNAQVAIEYPPNDIDPIYIYVTGMEMSRSITMVIHFDKEVKRITGYNSGSVNPERIYFHNPSEYTKDFKISLCYGDRFKQDWQTFKVAHMDLGYTRVREIRVKFLGFTDNGERPFSDCTVIRDGES